MARNKKDDETNPCSSGASAASKGERHVALLRGINVGGKNQLPMKALAGMFEDAGCTDVRTYIASGNVVFRTPAGVAKGLAAEISRRIAADFGLRVPVVLRGAKDFLAAAAGNPFLTPSVDTASLYVGFLADKPAPKAVRGLDPDRSPGDHFAVRGREVYMLLATGAAKTKLTNAYFDTTLQTVSTFRNWRTVLRLAAMLGT